MFFQTWNIFFLLIGIALLSAVIHSFLLNKRLKGRIVESIIVALITSFSGFFLGSLIPVGLVQWIRPISVIISVLCIQLALWGLGHITQFRD